MHYRTLFTFPSRWFVELLLCCFIFVVLFRCGVGPSFFLLIVVFVFYFPHILLFISHLLNEFKQHGRKSPAKKETQFDYKSEEITCFGTSSFPSVDTKWKQIRLSTRREIPFFRFHRSLLPSKLRPSKHCLWGVNRWLFLNHEPWDPSWTGENQLRKQ